MVIKNKKAWLRILEATTAILIITGVMLVMYSRSTERADISEYIYSLQMEVLSDISSNNTLRNIVVSDGNAEDKVKSYVSNKIPQALNFSIKICNLTDSDGVLVPCKMDSYIDKDIFVEEIIVSGNIQVYSPKKIRFFVWEAG